MGTCFVYYIKGRQWDSISTPAQACWMLRKNEPYKANIYTVLAPTIRVPWEYLLFSNPARPKARFTLWLQMHGRLVTGAWEISKLDPSTVSYREYLGAIHDRSHSESQRKSQQAQIFKMINTEFVHGIWIERNMRIFEKQQRHWEAIARDIACICSVYNTEFSP
ncbi:hypothetical protein KY284_019340 [Solanum tuberosum]|nr:hypothetical protein KY284_019340 [Solanum tuberosum]